MPSISRGITKDMSSRVEKDFVFDSCIHFDDKFLINSFNVSMSILIETPEALEQNIAIERIGYFIYTCINHSIFVNEDDVKAIQLYKKAGINVVVTPDDPYDQILAMLLVVKLNAITEGRLTITDLTLSSTLSDGIRFCIVSEIAEDTIDTSNPTLWWNQPNLCIAHNNTIDLQPQNIVKLFGDEGWKESGLAWKPKKVKK